MKRLLALLLLCCLVATNGLAQPGQPVQAFSFGVLASGARSAADEALREMLEQAQGHNLAFLVAQGIRTPVHGCTDLEFQKRKNLLDASKHGLLVSLSASDWATCVIGGESASDPSARVAKLTRVRELFYFDEFSLGATRIPLVHQSTEPKFHAFVENARWEIGGLMFATINLPANNNNFVFAAGRNGEFEDRVVANREWLRRLFTYAELKNNRALVLFAESNPLQRPAGVRRDGYLETRRQLLTLAGRYKGRVLIVHAQSKDPQAPTAIQWQGNIGELGVAGGWVRVQVDPKSSTVLQLDEHRAGPARRPGY